MEQNYEQVIFTNMCMVYDDDGNVLVQERVNTGWDGIVFPGGHVDAGEDFVDAVKREVLEESGLKISCPQLCGIKQWMREDGSRYVVLCYKTNRFSGTLTSSEEGEVRWVKLDELKKLPLARSMEKTVQLFLDDSVCEYSFYIENGERIEVLK